MAYEIKYINLKFTKMKRLGKLEINSEKILKNEELMSLRGGYDEYHLIKCFRDEGYCGTQVVDCSYEPYLDAICGVICPGWWGYIYI
jgi:hypothetical protein